MLQTATVLKSNFTRPIGCCDLAVKRSKHDHLSSEEGRTGGLSSTEKNRGSQITDA